MNAEAEAIVELMEPHEKRWIEPALTRALAAERHAVMERFYNEALALSWDDEHGNWVVAIDGLRLIREGVEEAT